MTEEEQEEQLDLPFPEDATPGEAEPSARVLEPDITASAAGLADRMASRVASEENKQLAAQLAADLTKITAQAITDPEGAAKELGFVRAATASLSASEALAVSTELISWVAAVVRATILKS